MRRFAAYGPAFVTLLAAGIVVMAVPSAIDRIVATQTKAQIALAQNALETDDVLARMDRALRNVSQAVRPSVVHIWSTSGGRAFSPMFGSTGSGWIFDDLGHVVTNWHVVKDGTRFSVEFHDGEVVSATLVGSDPLTDIAVLKVPVRPGLFPIQRATGERLQQGDRVFAFGSPFDYKFSMSEGVVSALGRSSRRPFSSAAITNYIQTDAAVNPGNSGGPLVDIRGRLVGMTVAIATPRRSAGDGNPDEDDSGQNSGVGFAIPLGTIESRVPQIVGTGRVSAGFLGIRFGNAEFIDTPAYRGKGVRIGEAVPSGPAARAGLRAGDVLVEINGQPIDSDDQMRALITAATPGQEISVRVLRGGELVSAKVVVGEASSEFRQAQLGQLIAEQIGIIIQERAGGVVIGSIPGGPADRAGSPEIATLLRIADTRIASRDDALAALARSGWDKGRPVLLFVRPAESAPDSEPVRVEVRP